MPPLDPRRAAFATTRWSLVERVRGGDADAARDALAELCALTWYPLYAFARRRGLRPDDALDATQGFFADFLARDGFARAEPERGRLRALLLTAFRNFLARGAERDDALKRGGGRAPLSLDLDAAEGRYAIEPADARTPERLYEAAWARAMLERVVESLRAEHEARGEGELFRALESELAGDSPTQAEHAARVGKSAGAFKVAAHRLRARYRAALREAIRATLADPSEVEDELAALLEALGGAPPASPGGGASRESV